MRLNYPPPSSVGQKSGKEQNHAFCPDQAGNGQEHRPKRLGIRQPPTSTMLLTLVEVGTAGLWKGADAAFTTATVVRTASDYEREVRRCYTIVLR